MTSTQKPRYCAAIPTRRAWQAIGSRATGAAVVGLTMALIPTHASAAPPEVVEVFDLTGETFQACDEVIRYTSGEVIVTEQEVLAPSGSRMMRFQMRVSGAVAVGEDSGLVYRDQTVQNWSTMGNPAWNNSIDFAEGSHGVNTVLRSRVFAPGSDLQTMVVTFSFHIRRVDGYYTDPPLVIDDPFTVVCR